MSTLEERWNARIPFGKNGIKDGNGRIIRTDHPTFMDFVRDMTDGGPTKKQILDKRIEDAIGGVSEYHRDADVIRLIRQKMGRDI